MITSHLLPYGAPTGPDPGEEAATNPGTRAVPECPEWDVLDEHTVQEVMMPHRLLAPCGEL